MKTDGWALIGKISAVIGVLISLNVLRGIVWPNEPKLQATCQGHLLDESLTRFHIEREWSQGFEPRLPAILEGVRGLSAENVEDIVKRLRSERIPQDDVQPEHPRSIFLGGEGTLFACTVTNTGNREATSIVLTAPVRVLFARVGEDTWNSTNRNVLDLPNVRPHAQLSVSLETGTPPSFIFLQDKAWTLTHSQGLGDVTIGIPVGSMGDLVRFLMLHPATPYIFGAVVVLIGFASAGVFRKLTTTPIAPNSDSGNDPNIPNAK